MAEAVAKSGKTPAAQVSYDMSSLSRASGTSSSAKEQIVIDSTTQNSEHQESSTPRNINGSAVRPSFQKYDNLAIKETATPDNLHVPKRKHRVKSSGGFLLDSVPFSNTLRNVSGFRKRARNGSAREGEKGKGKAIAMDNEAEEKTRESNPNTLKEIELPKPNGQLASAPNNVVGVITDASSTIEDRDTKTDNSSNEQFEYQHQHQQIPTIQITPTDIVNMALSLNESRKRQVSSGSYYMPSPPSQSLLTPDRRSFSPNMPLSSPSSSPYMNRDFSAGIPSTLQQNLQQQRHVPRSSSPSFSRRPSGFRLTSLTQSTELSSSAVLRQEEFGQQDQQHNFSVATLARAKKARNHIELGAEYRRLLEFLPRIEGKSNRNSHATSNNHGSRGIGTFVRRSGELSRVTTAEKSDFDSSRAYNPLQAIRNRRVRARERQMLDPDIDKWGDVRQVRPWVDKVEDEFMHILPTDGKSRRSILPDFGTMDESGAQNDSLLGSYGHSRDNSISKPKRQKMDWSVSPSELFADTYWVEQDQHKLLIEDHGGNLIFPSRNDASQHAGRKSKEINGDNNRDRPGFGDTRHRLTPSDLSAVEGNDSDSELSGRRNVLLRRPTLQKRFIRDRPFRRNRSSSLSSDDPHLKRGMKRRSKRIPTSHHNNIGPLERHMIDVMMEEEERERKEARERANETSALSATDSTDRGEHVKNTLSTSVSRQSTATCSASVSDDRHLTIPSKRDLRLTHTTTPINRPGPSSSMKDLSNITMASQNGSRADASQQGDSPTAVSRVRSLPLEQNMKKTSRSFGLESKDRNSRNSVDRHRLFKPNITQKLEHRDSDTVSDSEHGDNERSPITGPLRRLRSIKHSDGAVGNSGNFDGDAKHHGRIRDNSSAVGRFLKKGRLGGLVRHEGGKVNNFIRRHAGQGEDTWDVPTETPETSQSEADALESIPSQRPRLKHDGQQGRSSDTVLPERSQVGGYYNNNLPSFRSAAAANGDRRHDRSGIRRDSDKGNKVAHSGAREHDLSKISVSRSNDNAGRYPLNADKSTSSIQGAKDKRQSSREDGDLTRTATRQSSARLNAILDIPGAVGHDDLPMTGPANVKSNQSYLSANSKSQATAPTERHARHNHFQVVAPDGSIKVSIPMAAKSLSRTETLLLSSAVKAKEIVRMEHGVPKSPAPFLVRIAASIDGDNKCSIPPVMRKEEHALAAKWLAADVEIGLEKLRARTMAHDDIVNSAETSEIAPSDLSTETEDTAIQSATSSPSLASRTQALHSRIKALQAAASPDLSQRVRDAATAADKMISDLNYIRRVPAREVAEELDSVMRARRRRLRWVRRGAFLILEWMLLGAMWWVWLMVVLIKVVWKTGRGVMGAVRWFFWL